jgi:hypothetical protein
MKQWRYNICLALAMIMTTCASLIFFLPVVVLTAEFPMVNLLEAQSSIQSPQSPSDPHGDPSIEYPTIIKQHKKGSLSLKTAANIGANTVEAAILALGGRRVKFN